MGPLPAYGSLYINMGLGSQNSWGRADELVAAAPGCARGHGRVALLARARDPGARGARLVAARSHHGPSGPDTRQGGPPRHAALPRRVSTGAAPPSRASWRAGPASDPLPPPSVSKKMQDACEHLRDVSRARGGLEGLRGALRGARARASCARERAGALVSGVEPSLTALVSAGGLVGREDVEASLARIDLAPPTKLMDDVWSCLGAPGEKVSIWTVLSKLPAPRAGALFACSRSRDPSASPHPCCTGADGKPVPLLRDATGRSVERMLERIANVRESIKATVEQKRFRQTAELGSTEQRFWQELNTLRLGADGDDSAFKVCTQDPRVLRLQASALLIVWSMGHCGLTCGTQYKKRRRLKSAN